MTTTRADLVGLLSSEMEELLAELGKPRYKGRQLFQWVHARRAVALDSMTDLSKPLRVLLASASASAARSRCASSGPATGRGSSCFGWRTARRSRAS